MRITLSRLQRAIDYVEAHLSEPFSLDDVAAAAGLSRYHLHRLFAAGLAETLKGYIRKRRLTEAAERLRGSDMRIIELAFDSGFASQEAFTRAFQAQFGVTPGRYRRDPRSRSQPGLLRPRAASVRHRHRGVTHEPRLVERTQTLEVRGFGTGIDFENDAPVAALWGRLLETLRAPEPSAVLYGVAQASHPSIELSPEHTLAYIAGVCDTPWDDSAADVVAVTVPPGRYAVFEHRGALEHIIDTVNYAWATWLPRCAFEKSARPDLERVPLEQLSAAQPCIELWVSIDA